MNVQGIYLIDIGDVLTVYHVVARCWQICFQRLMVEILVRLVLIRAIMLNKLIELMI